MTNKVALNKATRGGSATSNSSSISGSGQRRRGNSSTTADDALPEAVDFSEGGWATDFAASLVGFLFFISALMFYENNDDDADDDASNKNYKQHFSLMYIGTGIAHLFGGMAHRWFPNRAADGVGHYGFYVTMIVAYGAGNCLRYGFGWPGLDPVIGYIAIANAIYMLLTGIFVMYMMEHTNELCDPAKGTNYWPDRLFGLGEAFCSIMEIVASLYFVVDQVGFDSEGVSESSGLFYLAVMTNLIGWAAVYKFALLYLLCNIDYDPSQMQRIFHYCMIIMLWSIDTAVRSYYYDQSNN